MFRLLQKNLRDLWNYKALFVSVLIMTLLGVATYAGIEGLWLTMKNNGDSYFKNQNLADEWIYCSSIEESDIDLLGKVDGVGDIGLQTIVNASISFNNEDNIQLELLSEYNNKISIPYTIEGEDYKITGSGCWIYHKRKQL